MDPLEQDDLELARSTSPEERANQTLRMMSLGFRLKRAALRERHPEASEEEIEGRFRRWLEGDD